MAKKNKFNKTQSSLASEEIEQDQETNVDNAEEVTPETTENIITEDVPQETVVPAVNFRLVVRNPFGRYKKGQIINDPKKIQSIIDSGKIINCCKTIV